MRSVSRAPLALFNHVYLELARSHGSLWGLCAVLRYQWLQSERQPAKFTEVVEELFQVIPDETLYMDSSPERCRTCAVVGNSGNLKGSQYGGLIDSCHFIIRSVSPWPFAGSSCIYLSILISVELYTFHFILPKVQNNRHRSDYVDVYVRHRYKQHDTCMTHHQVSQPNISIITANK